MKNFLFAMLLLPILLLAQTEKGASPIQSAVGSPQSGSTYAVVVGISDYQDPGIPDLRFADRDAEVFANFLRSPAGGSLDEDHLKLLTNSQATTGQLVAAMDWLVDACKEGDQAIIYFSGHGDVESKSAFNLGFLLTWDSPSKAYMAGAYPLFYLQAMVSTLSTENKTKVVLITDACRSGKLAGNDVAGNQLTNANLAKQFANEIKILSCQPNEYSIEGEQWGGGRGAFSYHLIDGLYGMADKNGDQAISLSEMDRYLEDHVTPEVAPHSQIPMTIGNRAEKLTTVFPELLAQVEKSRQGQMPSLNAIASKGMEDDVLATLDESGRELYQRFKTALSEQNFLSAQLGETQVACADAHYAELIKEPKLERLHATLRRNYAAALQDEAQQVLNKILNNDPQELSLSKFSQAEKYRLYPSYLQRAAELLGEGHYMFKVLQARQLYFEGYLLHIDNPEPNRELGENALAKYREALALQPEFPHPYYSMSAVFFHQMLQPDSAEYYAGQAVALAPSWFVPYDALAYMYQETHNSKYTGKIRDYLELADQVDSSAAGSNLWHMNRWASYFRTTNQFAEAERQYKKNIAIDPGFSGSYLGLGSIYGRLGRMKEAEGQFLKFLALDSTNWKVIGNLGRIYEMTHRHAEAEVQYNKVLQMDPANLQVLAALAGLYNLTGRFAEADSLYEKVFRLDSTTIFIYGMAGGSYAQAGRYDKAEEIFLKGLELDPNNVSLMGWLGTVYRLNSRYDKAEEIFLKGLELDPNNMELKSSLGLFYLWTNQLEKAEQQFQEIVSIDTSNFDLFVGHQRMAMLYAKMGRFEKAEQHLQMFPSTDKLSVPHLMVAAAVYGMQNQLDKAYDYLEQAFEIGFPDELKENLIANIDKDFGALQAQTERWEALMKKYFPEKSKD